MSNVMIRRHVIRRHVIRRHVVAGICAAAAFPALSRAQGVTGRARIGFLGLGSPAVAQSRIGSLRQGLTGLGYQDGRDYTVEVRTAGADPAALRQAAAELIALQPNVLVTHAAGTAVLKQATRTIPIVMLSGDAVTTGLVESLRRPGGNVTGMSFFSPELMAKRLELLKQALPDPDHAGVLALGSYPVSASAIAAVEATARSLNIRLTPVLVHAPGDLDRVFSELAEKRVRGLVVQDVPMLIANAKRIAELAAQRNILCIGFLELIAQGGHLAYSIDFDEMYRRLAEYVVKLLKGAQPGDLPVEQPTVFRLVVNAKAMKAFGVEAPSSLLIRADEVVE
jgi:putative ABC transport system substrate-binding protein